MTDPNFPIPKVTVDGTIDLSNALRNAYYIREDVMHKWLGSAIQQTRLQSIDIHILCAKMRKGPSGVMWITDHVDVTTENSKVTCPECLEWIHA